MSPGLRRSCCTVRAAHHVELPHPHCRPQRLQGTPPRAHALARPRPRPPAPLGGRYRARPRAGPRLARRWTDVASHRARACRAIHVPHHRPSRRRPQHVDRPDPSRLRRADHLPRTGGRSDEARRAIRLHRVRQRWWLRPQGCSTDAQAHRRPRLGQHRNAQGLLGPVSRRAPQRPALRREDDHARGLAVRLCAGEGLGDQRKPTPRFGPSSPSCSSARSPATADASPACSCSPTA